MKRGQEYLSVENYPRARVEFRSAIQLLPTDAAARIEAGLVAERTGQIRDAAGLYQSAIDLAPRNAEARAHLGRLYLFAGAPQRALDTLAPVLANASSSAELLIVRGGARAALKDPEGATADADRALQLAPRDPDAVALRAGLYRRAGELAKAIELAERSLGGHPQSAPLRELLTDLYLASDQVAAGEAQLRKLTELKPKELHYREQLAAVLARSQHVEEAQRVLEQAVQDLSDNEDASLALTSFVGAQRSKQVAEKSLREYIARQPTNLTLRLGLGELQTRWGEPDQALATYAEIARLDRGHSSGITARERMAAIYAATSREPEARKLIVEVLQENPKDSAVLMLRADLELRQRDFPAAIADLRAVVRDHPESSAARSLLARAYLASGSPNLAESALREGLEQVPNDTGLRLELARLLMSTGQADAVIKLLASRIADDPKDAGSREALANAYLAAKDYRAAQQTAADLAALRPDAAIGPYLAGVAAQALNKPDEAAQLFEQALQRQPDALEPLTALSLMEVRSGGASKALSRVQEAVHDHPKNAALWNLLGEVRLASNDATAAASALNQAASLAPGWWVPYHNLALLSVASHDTSAAIASYRRAVELAPRESQLTVELSQLYLSQSRVDEAIQCYEALHKHDPQLPLAANNLALLLATYKSDAGSLDQARDLVAGFGKSDNGNLLDTAGWVRYKRGEYADALPLLERAASRAPADPEVRYHLALAELHAGQAQQARSNLQLAVAGTKSHSWTSDARAALAKLGNTDG